MTQLVSPQETARTPPAKRKLNLRLLLPLALLIVGAVGIAMWYLSRPQSTALHLSGRIEGYPTNVGAKVGGRVDAVTLREGDAVRQGEILVRLDDAEIQAQLQGANARLTAAQQQEQQARLQIAVAQSQIEEAQFNLQQSQGDARGRIAQAEANVAAAQAQLSQTEAQLIEVRSQLELARKERDRFQQLLQAGAITQQQFDQTQTTFQTAQATLQSREAAVNAAQRQVNAAQGALVQAQSASLNPNIRNVQLNALHRQLDVARSQLAVAQAEVKNAQASRQQIQAQIAYLNVVSPINGVVLTRSVEPGEVVATGRTLLTVIDPNTVYLRGFIPGGQIGNVRLGQRANVFLDSAPDRSLAARVTAIDTQASFTPENIYFREDRVRQVFGVKLSIDDPQGFAKPGMPADGEIITQ